MPMTIFRNKKKVVRGPEARVQKFILLFWHQVPLPCNWTPERGKRVKWKPSLDWALGSFPSMAGLQVLFPPCLNSGSISSHAWALSLCLLLWRTSRIVKGSSAAVFCWVEIRCWDRFNPKANWIKVTRWSIRSMKEGKCYGAAKPLFSLFLSGGL